MFSIGEQIEGGAVYRDSTKWTTKSLNSTPTQQYSIPVSLVGPHTSPQLVPREAAVPSEPIPISIKITDSIFTLHTYSSLTVFHFIPPQLRKKNSKGSFQTSQVDVSGVGVRQVLGSPLGVFVVVGEEVILGYQIVNGQAVEVWRNQLAGIKCGALVQSHAGVRLLVLLNDTLQIYSVGEQFSLLAETKFEFKKPQQQELYNKLQPINIVVKDSFQFFLLGTTIQERKQIKKLRQDDEPPQKKQCEVLHIVKFTFKEEALSAKFYSIDHIFELNIFLRSRAFIIDENTFSLVLHEEFILIRKNFDRYIVWDNASVAASKSSDKKGQLVLPCEQILLFEDSGQISAVLNQFENEKLNLKLIDTLRGNDNDEEVLYSSLVLEHQNSLLIVLFYFKAVDIFIPNKPAKFMNNLKKKEGEKTNSKIFFKIAIIQQRDPVVRLKELLQQQKQPEDIERFQQRFFIQELILKKSQWEVSAKTEKQIESLLMEIPDNQYIQDELNKIMKEDDHDLSFLLSVEKNQVDRYRKMVAKKLLNLSDGQILEAANKNKKNGKKNITKRKETPKFSQSEKQQIKYAIKWLLQSKMMKKKLSYSLSFLSFKSYSFIEIGKLKAASLKEEIKLLCCKGYEKRLKYFMNSFKYLAIDDFSMILKFVIGEMNERQLQQFFTQGFPFLLPLYSEPQAIPVQDQCQLWADTFSEDQKDIETLEHFQQQIKKQIQRTCREVPEEFLHWSSDIAFQEFCKIFKEFVQENWFIANAYKQHSLLQNSLKDLKQNFYYMKKCGVCNTIVEFLYEGVETGNFNDKLARQAIQELTRHQLFTSKYAKSIRARLQVYDLLYFQKNKPTRPQLLSMSQPEYFSYLFNIDKKMLLTSIKVLYEDQAIGFFVERFQEYLTSDKAVLSELIESIDIFQSERNVQAVKQRLFITIKRLLTLKDIQNTEQFVSKLLDLEILGSGQILLEKVAKEEAKIAIGSNFHEIFHVFDLNNTYQDLVDQTEKNEMSKSCILSPLIKKYCAKDLDHLLKSENKEEKPKQILKISSKFDILKVSPINLCDSLDFFSLLLEFTNFLEFKINQKEIFEKYVEQFFEHDKFEVVEDFMNNFIEFGHTIEERDLIEKYENYNFTAKFKEENNLKHLLLNFILRWVETKYQYIASFAEIQVEEKTEENVQKISYRKVCEIFISISKSLGLLKKFVLSNDVEQAVSTISLFESLKNLQISLLLPIMKTAIKDPEKFFRQSGLFFMIHLLNNLPLNKLSQMKQSKPILQFLHTIKLIYKDFKVITTKSTDEELGDKDYARFCVQMTAYFINNLFFELSTFGLIELIQVKNSYCREMLFYFLSRTWKRNNDIQDMKTLIRQFFLVETPQLLENHLESFIGKNRIAKFVEPSRFKQNTESIFNLVLENGHIEEGYYFLIRCNEIKVSDLKILVTNIKRFDPEKNYMNQLLVCYFRILKKQMIEHFFPTFFFYESKIGFLERPYERQIMIKDINITIMKLQIKKKKGVKINEQGLEQFIQIYENYMKQIGEDPQVALIKNEEQIDQLGTLKCERYARQKSHKTDFLNSPAIDQVTKDEKNQTLQLRKKILEDDQRLREIQEKNKELLLQNKIVPYISEIKAEQLEKKIRQQERKKQQQEREKEREKMQNQVDILSRNIKGVQTQENLKIEKVKKNYTSKLFEQAKELVQGLRKKRAQAKGSTHQTFDKREQSEGKRSGHHFLNPNERKPSETSLNQLRSSKFLDPLHFKGDRKMRESYFDVLQRKNSQILLDEAKNIRSSNMPIKASNMFSKPTLKESSNYGSHYQVAPNVGLSESLTPNEINIKVTDPDKNQKVHNEYKPRTYIEKRQLKEPMAFSINRVQALSQSELIKKSKKQLQLFKEKSNQTLKQSFSFMRNENPQIKFSFQQILNNFSQNEPRIIPYLEKLKYVMNSVKTAQQIIRNIYKCCEKLENFVQLIEDLLKYKNDLYKEVFETKAILIVKQATSIKIQMSLKQLFYADFFLSIHNVALGEYYEIAFNLLKVNLPKLFENPYLNLSQISIMFRSAFGSGNTYFYKVYEEYLKYLTRQCRKTKINIKTLAEKYRTTFKNMNPETRMIKIQQTIKELDNVDRERELIEAIDKNIEHKKADIPQQQVCQWKVILTRMKVS